MSFKIFALNGEFWTQHAAGRARNLSPVQEAGGQLDLAAIQARCEKRVEGAQLYRELATANLNYGPAFRGVQSAWVGQNEALGSIELPQALQPELTAHRFHPALLDAALHIVDLVLPGNPASGAARATFVPFALQEIHVRRAPGAAVWSHVRRRSAPSAQSETHTIDIAICDEVGEIIAELTGFQVRELRAAEQHDRSPQAEQLLYEIAWEAMQPVAGDAHDTGPVLIIGDRAGVGEALARSMAEHGREVELIQPHQAVTVEDAATRLRAARARGAGFASVLNLRYLDVPLPTGRSTELLDAQQAGIESILALVKAIAGDPVAAPRLWLVTCGAQAVDGKMAAPQQAPLLGLGATIVTEHPELACTCVELDPADAAETSARKLERILNLPVGEEQIALRGENAFVPRLLPRADRMTTASLADAPPEAQLQSLHIHARGLLDNLVLQPLQRRAPDAGEVEIRVRATGLNFRDVLNVLDLYPGEIGDPGEECSGEVVRVGSGVDSLRAGDRVMAMASASFASYVTTDANLVVPLPAHLSFEDAATMPITFTTAYLALEKLAHLKRGERVMIHAAAGGVGMAAVQLAQRAGAEVFATAGNAEKRALLASMGVAHVFDSRSLDFAAGVLAASGGRGVDVVLNSLNGDFIATSLAVLAQGGRFLEIGKREIWTATQMAEARPDVNYFVIYLGDLAQNDPEAVQQMLRELMAFLAAGEIAPLHKTVFALAEVIEAFRFMAQARHIGKVIVTQPLAAAPALPASSRSVRILADATYLITGGLGGLGLALAQRLVAHGARTLALIGRKPAVASAQQAIRAMESQGAQVRVMQADIASEAELQAVLDTIEKTLPPLRGIVHAAGINDDGVLMQQDWARFKAVFAPKIAGAWNLHTLARAYPLDFFVLFSSVAPLLGMAAQGNYAAANAFLDALAAYRRAQGLEALSIAWGPWQMLGMTARLNRSELERVAALGLVSLASAHALDGFDQALALDAAHVAVVALNLPALDASRPRSLFAGLRSATPTTVERATPSLLDGLLQTAPSMRHNKLLAHIRERAIKVLGLPPSYEIAPRQAFSDLGLDSLLAIELRNALSAAFAMTLPATLLFDYPTGDTLAAYLLKQIPAPQAAPDDSPSGDGTGHAQASISAPPKGWAAKPALDDAALADLSDEEAEALLLAELDGTAT